MRGLSVLAVSRVLGCGSLAGALAVGPASAQSGPPAIAGSLTSDSTHPVAGSIADEDVFEYGDGSGALERLFTSQGWCVVFGDLDGNGACDPPGDVDGLWVSGFVGSIVDMSEVHLSLLQDQGGLLDGDVVQVVGTVPTVILPEALLVTATGASDGNVDLADFAFDPLGNLFFSFAQAEASTTLPTSGGGTIDDGDILYLPIGSSTASILFTENQVQAMVDQAMGSAQSAIGGVNGLEWDPMTGQLFFTVRSPSAIDGSLFSTDAGGTSIAGYAEADLGFGTAIEIDAIALVPVQAAPPTLEVDVPIPTANSTVTLTLRSGSPGATILVLGALSNAGIPIPTMGGTGILYLSVVDPLFAWMAAAGASFLFPVDPQGIVTMPAFLGNGNGLGLDLYLQAIEIPTLRLSTPTCVALP